MAGIRVRNWHQKDYEFYVNMMRKEKNNPKFDLSENINNCIRSFSNDSKEFDKKWFLDQIFAEERAELKKNAK